MIVKCAYCGGLPLADIEALGNGAWYKHLIERHPVWAAQTICANRPGRGHEWYRRSGDGLTFCRDCGFGWPNDPIDRSIQWDPTEKAFAITYEPDLGDHSECTIAPDEGAS